MGRWLSCSMMPLCIKVSQSGAFGETKWRKRNREQAKKKSSIFPEGTYTSRKRNKLFTKASATRISILGERGVGGWNVCVALFQHLLLPPVPSFLSSPS